MQELSQEQLETQGVEYWENELRYLESALDGLRTSYALLDSMREHANEKYKSLLPNREDI